MFDLEQVWTLAKIEPGHNLAQCVLLFMIWWSSRGLKQEVSRLNASLFTNQKETKEKFEKVDKTLNNHEGRISTLETKIK